MQKSVTALRKLFAILKFSLISYYQSFAAHHLPV